MRSKLFFWDEKGSKVLRPVRERLDEKACERARKDGARSFTERLCGAFWNT